MSLQSRRKHKAQGGAKRNPGLTRERIRQARETGDSGRTEGLCRPLARAGRSFDQLTQGSASLHPGLYAVARLGGLVEWFRIWLRPTAALCGSSDLCVSAVSDLTCS